MNTNEFIKKARIIHEDKYNYDKAEYINTNTPVIITCPEHGDFEQTPKSHLTRKRGCSKCATEKNKGPRITTEEFVNRAKAVHGGKYDYSKSVFVGALEKLIITCPIHGDFEQQAASHLSGKGCRQCANIALSEGMTKTTAQFIKDARKVHGDKYSYDKTVYVHGHKKVMVTCPKHGDFEVSPSNHLFSKSGCPKCYR